MPRPLVLKKWLPVAVLAAAGAVAVAWRLPGETAGRSQPSPTTQVAAKPPSSLPLDKIPFNGARAYEYLRQVCELGPRPSGSAGMAAQQKLLVDHFQRLDGQVRRQRFQVRHPQTGQPVTLTNLIVHWRPQTRQRILLAVHYDTRPYPDRDPQRPRGQFIGANDGASGVALLMELAHEMATVEGKLGVDFILFDAEEFVFKDTDHYFMGSEYFAHDYATQRPRNQYRAAVVLDMVADADLQLHYEGTTMSWPESRPVAEGLWSTARELGIGEFVPQVKHAVRDDHLALREVAGIPACDVIDFDYPHWHTEADLPDKCSAESLAKVGYVVREWLKKQVR